MADERSICKALGVTPTGLGVLAKADIEADGRVRKTRGPAAEKLARSGFLTPWIPPLGHRITDAGRDVVRRARAMGW